MAIPFGGTNVSSESSDGPRAREWARAKLSVTEVGTGDDQLAIFERRQAMVVSGVRHERFMGLTRR
ncbi:MAG TPA: hypothetical protein DCQ98_18265 [Planctomycetaceae bacterium]|nr:hypothetical protein [Planctomycetaceae bacterium]